MTLARRLFAAIVGGLLAAPASAASPHTDTSLIEAVIAGQKSVMVVTRAKDGRLQPDAAASATSAKAFSIALGRTFATEGEPLAAHSRPLPLPQQGALASGFVAAVDGYDGRCGFAIGGLDYSGNGGADGLDASAALIFCAPTAAHRANWATPTRVAAHIAKLPRQ